MNANCINSSKCFALTYTLMQSDYDWAAACVLDFFSDELVVGPEETKLRTVHYDDMAAFFKPWSNHYAL